MEDRPYIAFQRSWLTIEDIFLWSLVVLAAGIRVYYSFHIFISDEFFNLSTIETLVTEKGFSPYFFRHPPLYILLSSLISYFVGLYPQVPSFISILFSVLSIIPIYRIADHLMGKKEALWASLIMTFMPVDIYYSSWIKQDAMLLFFFSWGVYFYLKENYLVAGVVIGIALLVKEFALFFFPLSFLITVFVRKRSSISKDLYSWLKMSMIAAILSSWWYVLFGTSFYIATSEALTGGNIKELVWHLPWWFYIKNIFYDLSFFSFFLFLIGIVLLVKEIYKHGPLEAYIVPIMWFLVFYLQLSFITVKAPWYIYLATPALAIISSFGFVEMTKPLKSRRIKLFTYFIVPFPLLFGLYEYNNDKFYESFSGDAHPELMKDIQGKTWGEMNERKHFWRDKMSGINRVGFLEFRPAFLYLMGLKDDEVFIIKVSKFMASDVKDLSNLAKEYEIGAFVINSESLVYTSKNLEDMVLLWGSPERVGSVLIFRTS